MRVYRYNGKEYTDFDEFMEEKRRNEDPSYIPPLKEKEAVSKNNRPVRRRRMYGRVFRTVRNTSVVFLCISFVAMSVLLVLNIRSEARGREKFSDLRNRRDEYATETQELSKTGAILPDYITLHAQNSDLTGWLSIDYTSIDYPVMYRENDNDYYLSKNFDGEYDSNGMLILDKRCDPDGNCMNMLIHGHNMKSGLMFGGLHKYLDQGYAEDHQFIKYSTLYEKHEYQVIAVFISSVDVTNIEDFKFYNFINVDDPLSYEEYIRGIKEQSIYQTDATAEYGDKLITLSTCDYSKSGGRLVMVAKQVN